MIETNNIVICDQCKHAIAWQDIASGDAIHKMVDLSGDGSSIFYESCCADCVVKESTKRITGLIKDGKCSKLGD